MSLQIARSYFYMCVLAENKITETTYRFDQVGLLKKFFRPRLFSMKHDFVCTFSQPSQVKCLTSTRDIWHVNTFSYWYSCVNMEAVNKRTRVRKYRRNCSYYLDALFVYPGAHHCAKKRL